MGEGRKMKTRLNAFSKLVILIATILCGMCLPISIVKTANQTNLKVQPQQNIFYTNTTSVGTTFDISVIVENVENFYGWEFVLEWTPGLINCTTEKLNLHIWSAHLGPWIPDPINNTKSEYHQSITGAAPGGPVAGSFWLANLTFKIVQAPSSGGILQTNLTLTKAPGYTYCLIDYDGYEIPHGFINGVYKYISPRPPIEEIKVQVTPPSIMDPALVPCTTFNVNITATSTSYLHGFSLKLGYNATIIECTNLQEGNLLKLFGPTTMNYTIDNTLGKIYASVNLTSSSAMANGSGSLVKLSFHVKEIGESPLHLYETLLYDYLHQPLTYTTKDGYFNNLLMPVMPVLYIDPPLIVDQSMKPSDLFQIDVKVANVSNLYDFEFTLLYDTNVLNGLGIITFPFGNSTTFTTELLLNDTAGKIWVKVQYYPPAEPLTTLSPVTILRIFFQVQSRGATPLDLTDTSLSDYYGNEITHMTKDGYISILRRDVAVIQVIPDFTEVYKGWTIKINVTAKNLGEIAETFNVTLFFNSNKAGVKNVTALAPNNTIVLTFLFNTNQIWLEPCHNYTVSAEASEVPYEIDTTNNKLEDGQVHIKLMGDINGDRYVNAADAILLGQVFGTKIGNPRYSPNADLNQDGYINAKDVILMGINFGAHCGP
jgi:hypothetical protein